MSDCDATISSLLIDALSRSQEVCHDVLAGLTPKQANWRPDGVHNSITWLVWHLARQQDVQIAALRHSDDVWRARGWVERFGLELPPDSMGYGHTPEQVAKVTVADLSLLAGYLDAAVAQTQDYLANLTAASLGEVIDTRWTPPVTRGVRVVSIIDDAAQHAGQAAYVKGLLAKAD